jgi:hypothetical protein
VTQQTNHRTRKRTYRSQEPTAPEVELPGPARVVHWWLAHLPWPQGCVSRKMLYALTMASTKRYTDDRHYKSVLRRAEKRGEIQRGMYVIRVLNREALAAKATLPPELDTTRLRVSLGGIERYIAEGGNAMLAHRLSAELEVVNATLLH